MSHVTLCVVVIRWEVLLSIPRQHGFLRIQEATISSPDAGLDPGHLSLTL